MDPSRQELNPYQYSSSNPVNFTDPSGMDDTVCNWWDPNCDPINWDVTCYASMVCLDSQNRLISAYPGFDEQYSETWRIYVSNYRMARYIVDHYDEVHALPNGEMLYHQAEAFLIADFMAAYFLGLGIGWILDDLCGFVSAASVLDEAAGAANALDETAGALPSVLKNQMSDAEYAFAQRITQTQGGVFEGQRVINQAGIDGWYNGYPASLKQTTGTSPVGVLRYASPSAIYMCTLRLRS